MTTAKGERNRSKGSGEPWESSLDGWVSATDSVLPQPLLVLARRTLAADIDRRIELIMHRYHSDDPDPFGFDFNFAVRVLLIAGLIYRFYFRVRLIGAENVPQGRCLLVANHSGQIPIDGAMIATGLLLDAPEPRLTRALFDKWAATLPFVNTFFTRCGQLVGLPENLDLLMKREEMVLVFPEGSKGIVKPFARAYTLSDFGSGFMRLALEHRCPIVPLAVIGAEEQYPSLADIEKIARALHMPGLPLPIQFFVPFLGILPLPTKYRIYIGEPMIFEGSSDEEDSTVTEKVRSVRRTIQVMLDRGLKERRHIFW